MFQTLKAITPGRFFFKIQLTNHKLSAHLGIFCQPNKSQPIPTNQPTKSLPGLCGLRPGGHGDLPRLVCWVPIGIVTNPSQGLPQSFVHETKPMIYWVKMGNIYLGGRSKLSKRYKCVVCCGNFEGWFIMEFPENSGLFELVS